MKYKCPHCGEKTFSPIQKALCGNITSAGKHCPNCGGRCVNGKLCLTVRTILTLAAFGFVMYYSFTYFSEEKYNIILWGAVLLAGAYVVSFLFNMFFGALIPAIRRE